MDKANTESVETLIADRLSESGCLVRYKIGCRGLACHLQLRDFGARDDPMSACRFLRLGLADHN
jgi:hypothetical protein